MLLPPIIIMTHDYSHALSTKMLAGFIMSGVCLRWDKLFRLRFCIYKVTCVELAHSSLDDWKNIFITHLIIILKSEVSTFPMCLRTLYYHILSSITYIYPGNTGTSFSLLVFILWYLQLIGYIMACRSCSFVCRLHHLIIIIRQTYLKALNF